MVHQKWYKTFELALDLVRVNGTHATCADRQAYQLSSQREQVVDLVKKYYS